MDQLEWIRVPHADVYAMYRPALILPDGVTVEVRDHAGGWASAAVHTVDLSLSLMFPPNRGGLQAAFRFAGSHLSGHMPRALDELVALGPTPKLLTTTAPPSEASAAPGANADAAEALARR